MVRKTIALLAIVGFFAASGWAGEENHHKKTVLGIEGMTCGGCVAAVKAKLKKTEGVLDYEVNLEKAEADVEYDSEKTDPEKIAESVSATGFKATVKEKQGKDASS